MAPPAASPLRGHVMLARRPFLLTLLAALIAIPAMIATSTPAQADLYRFWSFWEQNAEGEWTFIQTGPGDVVPANGAVEGWRFGVGGVDQSTNRPPRTEPTFTEVCGNEPAPSGQKKIAVVIDTGTAEDAPDGATAPQSTLSCATVPEAATAVQTLQEVATTRSDGGIICAIYGYPPTGCGDTVAGATAVPTDTPTEFVTDESVTSAPSSSGPPLVAIGVGIAAVVVVLAAVLVAMRRRRD